MTMEPIRKIKLSDSRVRYRLVVDAGRTPDGRRSQRTSTHRTLKEARDALAQIRAGLAGGTYIPASKTTAGGHLQTWLAHRRDVRPSTLRQYRDSLAPYIATFGGRPLQQLTKMDVERVVTEQLSTGGRSGLGRAPRTVNLGLTILSQALEDAVKQGLLPRNVAKLVMRPKQQPTQMSTWTVDECRAFLEQATQDRLHAAWELTLRGLRRGEVCGLRWDDIDLKQSVLRIRQTRTEVDGRVVIGEPKTSRSRRALPMDPTLTAALHDLRRRQASERLTAGPAAYDDSGWIVVDELGRAIAPSVYSDRFARLARRAALPVIRLHDARHSWATLAHLNGVPVATISAWLGHATASFTMSTYVHSQADSLRAAGSLMGDLLAGTPHRNNEPEPAVRDL